MNYDINAYKIENLFFSIVVCIQKWIAHCIGMIRKKLVNWTLPFLHCRPLKDSANSPFNPIPAEVLENQDTLGGGVNLTPPSKSHV